MSLAFLTLDNCLLLLSWPILLSTRCKGFQSSLTLCLDSARASQTRVQDT